MFDSREDLSSNSWVGHSYYSPMGLRDVGTQLRQWYTHTAEVFVTYSHTQLTIFTLQINPYSYTQLSLTYHLLVMCDNST